MVRLGRSMGNVDFSTISVILGECLASRLVLKEGRPAVRNGPWRVGWAEPCGERDAPARREFGFYLGVARCNLSLPACIPAFYKTSLILRARPPVSAVALTMLDVKDPLAGRRAIITETNE